MSWANARDTGIAYWGGSYGSQRLSITPTSNIEIPQSTNQGPILSLKPNGNSVEIPIQSWYKYATLNGEIYFVDPVTSNVDKLHTEEDNLYWNDVLVATHDNISSISDWSLFPALSTIEVDYNDIHQVSTIDGIHARFSTINVSSIVGSEGTFSTLTASTLYAPFAHFSTVSSVSMTTSTIEANKLLLDGLSNYGVLNTDGTAQNLYWNNELVLTSSNSVDVSQWAKYPAISTITSLSTTNLVLQSDKDINVVADESYNVTANDVDIEVGGYLSGGPYKVLVNGGVDPTTPALLHLNARNGIYGKVLIEADAGFPVGEPIDAGGLIQLIAYSATDGTTPAALSRVDVEAATVTIQSGAFTSPIWVPGAINLVSAGGSGIFGETTVGPIRFGSYTNFTAIANNSIYLGSSDIEINGANGTTFSPSTTVFMQDLQGLGGFTILPPFVTQPTLHISGGSNAAGLGVVTIDQCSTITSMPGQYVSINGIDNQNMSPSTLNYIASTINASNYSTSVLNWALYPAISTVNFALNNVSSINNLTANYIYAQGNIDAIGTVSAFSGAFSAITGPGTNLAITNTGNIKINTSNGVYVNKLPSVGTEGDGDLFTGTLAASAGITAGGNISTSNAVVGSIGAFSQIDSVSTILFQGGASITRNGTDLTILDSISTQHFYSQVNITTDGQVNTNTLQASSWISTPTVNTQALLVSSVNGLMYPVTKYNASYSCSSNIPVIGANTVTPLYYDTVDVNNGGFSYLGSTITVPVAGTYEIIPSIQFDKTGGGTANAFFWAKINGTDVPNSATEITIAGPTAATVGTASIFLTMSANDKFEIVYASADANMIALAVAAQTSPYSRPANPSIIVTIKKLS